MWNNVISLLIGKTLNQHVVAVFSAPLSSLIPSGRNLKVWERRLVTRGLCPMLTMCHRSRRKCHEDRRTIAWYWSYESKRGVVPMQKTDRVTNNINPQQTEFEVNRGKFLRDGLHRHCCGAETGPISVDALPKGEYSQDNRIHSLLRCRNTPLILY